MSEWIKTYGEFWNPDVIDWGSRGRGNKGCLWGTVRYGGNDKKIDFWNAKGIYVLYDNFNAIYVGKTEGQSIGKRLRDHLTDRLAGRWDMFSWYSLSSPRFTRKDVSLPGGRHSTPDVVIDTMEALAILIADPKLNRKRESLPNAYEATQFSSPHPHTIRHYLQAILAKVEGEEGEA